MTHQINNDVDTLHNEFRQLAKACAQVQAHPALAQLQNPASFTSNHAALMLHHAEQLDRLFAIIHRHASTLQKLAAHDPQAAGISAIANRTVSDLTNHVQPMIATLRTKGLELLQTGSKGSPLQTMH